MFADRDEQIVAMLTACQDRLFAYILTLVVYRDIAHDILQETNLVLWRRRKQYEPNTNFIAWAYKTSYFQVLAYRRDRGRDRHAFSDDVLMQLASESTVDADQLDGRREALAQCLKLLPGDSRALIEQRYTVGTSIERIAEKENMTAGAARTAIYRVRMMLRDCVLAKISGGAK